jgi:hypothetical protein
MRVASVQHSLSIAKVDVAFGLILATSKAVPFATGGCANSGMAVKPTVNLIDVFKPF